MSDWSFRQNSDYAGEFDSTTCRCEHTVCNTDGKCSLHSCLEPVNQMGTSELQHGSPDGNILWIWLPTENCKGQTGMPWAQNIAKIGKVNEKEFAGVK